jgi:hypothetical protein
VPVLFRRGRHPRADCHENIADKLIVADLHFSSIGVILKDESLANESQRRFGTASPVRILLHRRSEMSASIPWCIRHRHRHQHNRSCITHSILFGQNSVADASLPKRSDACLYNAGPRAFAGSNRMSVGTHEVKQETKGVAPARGRQGPCSKVQDI